MRFLVPLVGLLVLGAPAQAQPIEDAFASLLSFTSVNSEDDDEGGGCYESCVEPFNPFASIPPEEEGVCAGFSNTQLLGIVGITAASMAGVAAALYCGYGDDFCDNPCLTNAIPQAAHRLVVTQPVGDSARPLVLEVVQTQPRGVGEGLGSPSITVRAFDAETRQPVALGPLGSTTATVRTADDLRALLGSVPLGPEADRLARRDP